MWALFKYAHNQQNPETWEKIFEYRKKYPEKEKREIWKGSRKLWTVR